MGLFDTYRPANRLTCPVCGRELTEWQGKDGLCCLFVWQQGTAAPVGQDWDEQPFDSDKVIDVRLPETFTIYSYDCGCPFPVEAECRTINGVWTVTELITAENAVQGKAETNGQFKLRMLWLQGRWTPAHRRWEVR